MTRAARALRQAAHEFRRFCANESGATAIEYAMIAAGIAVAIVAAVTRTRHVGEEHRSTTTSNALN